MNSSSSGDIRALTTRLADLEAENRALRARLEAAPALATFHGDLEAILHSIDGIVWEVDLATMTFAFVSAQAERILGYPLARWMGDAQFWPSILHADDREGAIEFCDRMTRAGRDHDFDYRMIAADGRVVWIHDRVHVVLEAGQPVRLQGVMFDITERKRAEERLALDAQLLALVHDSVVVTDLNGTITYWNAGAEQLFGGAAAERVGRKIYDHYPEPARTEALERFRRIVEGEELADEYQAYRQDGSAVWIDARVRRFTDADGRPAGVIGISRDVEDRRRAQERVREREEWYRALVEDAFDTTVIIDASAVILHYHTSKTSPLQGFAPEEQLGRVAFEDVHPDDLALIAGELRKLIADPDYLMLQRFRVRHKDGRWIWVEARARNLLDHPVVRGVVANMIDVTERVRAEEEHKQLQAKLLEAQKLESVGVLAGGIAHDFNNLLTSMLGYATLARDSLPAASPAEPMLQEVEEAARRAADLTQQLLAYAGKGRFVVQLIHLPALVREMARLLKTVVSKKTTFQVADSADVPAIEGDPTQVRQVVMNLITNASEALGGREGTVVVSCGVESLDESALQAPHAAPDASPGTYVFLEVADTGCGMDAETKARIFDPFFSTKFTGRGLGLAAVLGIVRGHRGLIRVVSAPGQGTTIRVYLPAAADVPAAALPVAPAATWHGRGAVLVTDDEEGIRTLVKTVLERAGLEPILARDGREAIALFRKHADRLAAALIDLTMPGLDGLEVAEQLQLIRPGVPVLLMSGYSEHELTGRGGHPAIRGFLPKPFRPEDLLRALSEAMQPADARP